MAEEEAVTETVTGGVDLEAVDQSVERGLKRSRLESPSDDAGGVQGHKLYKPDIKDPSLMDGADNTNPEKYNFGPYFQMRDVREGYQGGIQIASADDAAMLVFTVGGDAGVKTRALVRPPRTAIMHDPRTYPSGAIRPTIEGVAFFPTAEFSLALVIMALGAPTLYLTVTLPTTMDAETKVVTVPNFFPVPDMFGMPGIHLELRSRLPHPDGSFLTDGNIVGELGVPGRVRVEQLLDTGNYVRVIDTAGGLHEFSCWPMGGDDFPLGLNTVSVVQGRLSWTELPKQLDNLAKALEVVSGCTVCEIQAAEATQNMRIDTVEAETGVVPVPADELVEPTADEPYPEVRLYQRLAYLNALTRGTSGLFTDFNPVVSTVPFSCVQTYLPLPQQGLGTIATKLLYQSQNLPEQGALQVLFSTMPVLQDVRDRLTRYVSNDMTRSYVSLPNGGQVCETSGDTSLYVAQMAQCAIARFSRKHANGAENTPGKENMRLICSNGLVFDLPINLSVQSVPNGFVLGTLSDDTGDFVPYPTHYDPTPGNSVDNAYMPIDQYEVRKGPISFMKYQGVYNAADDQYIRDVQFEAAVSSQMIAIEYEVTTPGGLLRDNIDVRGELARIDVELARLSASFAPGYASVRGFQDRLARLERWKESI